ncbi:MAG: acyl-CoA desaturase, partial [Patescibacteria group bacterium]
MQTQDHGLAGDQTSADRAALTVFVVAPPVALATGIRRLWKREKIGGTDLAMLAVMHVIGSLGITVGYHRMLTHQGFKARPWLRNLFTVMGSMAVQGQPSHWVGDHRKHHAFTDREGDPHSPHLSSFPGILGKAAGMGHAHVGWLFSMDQSSIEKHAPDILKDEEVMAVDRHFGKISFLSLFAIPFTVGALRKRSVRGGLRTAFWAGPVRLALTQHITWSVNSVCHVFGSRPFGINRKTGWSTNNWVVGLLAWG